MTTLPSSAAKILERIDFFFGDSNFRRDKFLRNEAANNPQGFVSIEVLLRFNTLRALTDSAEDVAAAAEKSDVVVVSDDRKSIRRKSAKVPSLVDSNVLSVFAKGIPAHVRWQQVREVFEGAAGCKVSYVKMRRGPEGPSGCAIVELATEEDAAKLLAIGAEKLRFPAAEEGADAVPLELLQRLEDFLASEKARREAARAKQDAENEAAVQALIPKKCLIVARKMPVGANWIDLKQALSDVGARVMFVDIDAESNTGFARLYDAADASAALEKVEGGIVKLQSGGEAEVSLADAETEKSYWDRMFSQNKEKSVRKQMDALRAQQVRAQRPKGKGRAGKGGRGDGRFKKGKNTRGRGRFSGSNRSPLGKRERTQGESSPASKKAKGSSE
jgi:hypothetical protein